MQHALLITAYKNFDQLSDLIDCFDESFRCYIHIDKKSSFTDEQIKSLSEKINVDFVSKHYSVNWGGINHLLSVILLLKEAQKNTKNEYFHFITGQDFPIKSIAYINTFFKKNNGKEYLEFNKLPYAKWDNGGYDRIDYYNMCDTFNRKSFWGRVIIRSAIGFQKLFKLKRKYYDGFPTLYGGSTYWSVSKDCMTYIVQYLNNNPQYLKRFESTFCAEEFFFQTIVLNSPFKDNVVNNPLRFVVWEERNGNFPANLDLTDKKEILKSDSIFARKFEPTVSQLLAENIKSEIL